MGRWERVAGAGLIVPALAAALLVASAPAAAAPKRITGKLDVRGYTVIALAANGAATTDRAPRGRFGLRPPRRIVTLHLRARDGTYAGPVVAGTFRKGRRAITGVRAGAKLRKVDVRKPRGYSRVARKLPERLIDAKRHARAKRGAPIGAGNFGRVRSKRTRGGVPGDPDLDGVPDQLDIDDDGDLVLDNLEGGATAARAQAAARVPSGDFYLNSEWVFCCFPDQVLNANAMPLTREQVDENLMRFGVLGVERLPGDSAELDCGGRPRPGDPAGWIGGLGYCTRGGTGGSQADWTGPQNGPPDPFPECCDSDGDGFGAIDLPGGIGIVHGATTDEIGTGDVLVQRVVTDGAETQYVAALQFVLPTQSALVSYSDDQGNDAFLSYPVAPGGPGTEGNGLPVKANANGDIVLMVTFWRPQRPAIPGEPGAFTDVGGLHYMAWPDMTLGGDPDHMPCPPSAYSTTDPSLDVISRPRPIGHPPIGATADAADDQPPDPANTLTYSLNLTPCLERWSAPAWGPGEEHEIAFIAETPTTSGDKTVVRVFFEVQ